MYSTSIQKPILIKQNPQGQGLYQAPNGQMGSKEQAESIFTSKVSENTNQRYNDVYSHEAAHQSAAGSLGGGINIDYGTDQLGNPFAKGGHVPIKMPGAVTAETSLTNIEKAEEQAKIVAAAAVAPKSLGGDAGKLSGADESVNSQANALLGTVATAKSQRMVLEANFLTQKGKKPNNNQELTPEMTKPADNSNNPDKPQLKNKKPINLVA